MARNVVIAIPNFSNLENAVNGHVAVYHIKVEADSPDCFVPGISVKVAKWFKVGIFLNGNTRQNDGHVSLMVMDLPSMIRDDVIYFHCTVSVVDANGELRFPQSFGMDTDGGSSLSLTESSVGLERFIRRSFLVDSEEDLLPEDTLTLSLEIVWGSSVVHSFDILPVKLHKQMEPKDPYFWTCIPSTSSVGIHPFLFDLRNDDGPLSPRLQEAAQHCESLFRNAGREEINKSEVEPILDLTQFLRKEDLQHVRSVDKCIALYYLTHKYGRLDLKEICSARLKSQLTCKHAVEILDVAELCNDAVLSTSASTYVILNWKNVGNSEEWKTFLKICAVRAREIQVEGEIHGEVQGDSLRKRALRCLLLNWKEMWKCAKDDVVVRVLIEWCWKQEFDWDARYLYEILDS